MRTINVIDAHAVGESGRVVVDQFLKLDGETMAERLQNASHQLEDLRRLVLHEPRGFPSLCAPVVLPPIHPDSDFGLIVMEQGGFRPMSGSNLICAVTALVASELVRVNEPITYLKVDTAAGTVDVQARIEDGNVTAVSFANVESFPVALDVPLEVGEYGEINADIAFGGQFYVQADVSQFGLELEKNHSKQIINAASALCAAAREQFPVAHPLVPELNQIHLPMLFQPKGPENNAKNAVVLPNGVLNLDDPSSWTGTFDRSPCGTGTSARAACMHARGELSVGEEFIHESMLGTKFRAKVLSETKVGEHSAIIPEITGQGWVTGFNTLVVDPTDPFQQGFTVGDIWGTE
ncbi:proline racemase family protein [Corynebacterium hadale]|nr:proline racemase family protein [Corynebacterium hadale]